MAGFLFGSISYLDPTKTFICFIAVIAFVISFDVVIGVLEYYLEGSPVYNRMVQMIYKELMLMGVVSFIIIMIQAARKADNYALADRGGDWIAGIDYSHIVLFFLTFSFVVHAFFFMRQSILSSTRYRRLYSEKVPNLIKELTHVESYPQSRMLFYLQYLPLSQLRDKVEFYLMVALFRDTYWLPTEFNFADYLSGCYSRYALKTIDRSFFTWGIILVLVALNYMRESLGMRLSGCGEVATDDGGGGGGAAHRHLLGRMLSGAPPKTSDACVYGLVDLFLLCAAMLLLYTMMMMYVSRVYKIRMMYRIGFQSPSDYIEFLKFSESQVEKDKIAAMLANRVPGGQAPRDRMTMADLKRDIERVLDEDEHGEEAEFKAVAEFLSMVSNSFKELIISISIQLRLLVKLVRSGGRSHDTATPCAPILAASVEAECAPSPDSHAQAQAQAHPAADTVSGRASEVSGASPRPSPRPPAGKLSKMPSILQAHHPHDDEEHVPHTPHTAHSAHSSGGKAAMVQRLTMRGSFIVENAGPGSARGENISAMANPHSARPLVGSPRPSSAVFPMDNIAEEHHSVARQHLHEDDKSTATPAMTPVPQSAVPAFVPPLAIPSASRAASAAHSPQMSPTHAGTAAAALAHGGGGGGLAPSPSHEHAPAPARARADSMHGINAPHGVREMLNNINFAEEDGNSFLLPTSGKLGGIAPQGSRQNHNRRQSVAVHAPDNNYSTIEKFRKHKFTERRRVLGDAYRAPQLGTPRRHSSSAGRGWLTWIFESNKVDAEHHDMEANPDDEFRLSSDFSDIFLWNKPELFFGAVEVCIMFNCLYMAFWVTDFLALAAKLDQPIWEHALYQGCMAVPAVLVLPCIGYIIETCALLRAISDLNLDVVHEVLEETEDTKILVGDLRNKMMKRIKVFETLNQDKVQIIHALFDEIDQDGSGSIDKVEFRFLLRALKLTFSNDRFNRLFRAVDTSGDGNLGWDELYALLFPNGAEGKGECGEGAQDAAKAQESVAIMNTAEVGNLAQRLRSLSNISDYSDTDSDEDGKAKEKRKHKADAKAAAANAHASEEGLRRRRSERDAEDGKLDDGDVVIVNHRPDLAFTSAMQRQIDRELGNALDDDMQSITSDG